MKKFQKLLLFLLVMVIVFSLSACKKSDVPTWLDWLPWLEDEQTPITCDIKFAKTVDEKYQATEWYEGNEFEINKTIYVIVDFTLINYGSEDDFVQFDVHIPYAKYYSTHEYKKGIIEPTEDHRDIKMPDGTIEKMIVLSDMYFLVKTGQTPFHYTYCFAIEGNQVCESAMFQAIFKGKISEGKDMSFSKSYSFVLNAGGND